MIDRLIDHFKSLKYLISDVSSSEDDRAPAETTPVRVPSDISNTSDTSTPFGSVEPSDDIANTSNTLTTPGSIYN